MKSFTTALVLGVVLALAYSQEAQDSTTDSWSNNGFPPGKNWTTCDITTTPAISCHDCTTRMICKPVGGLLLACRHPYRPYCNNGICSTIPMDGCA